MIWQEEQQEYHRKREWWAFYAGILVASGVMGLLALYVVQMTGGIHGACP